MWISKIATAGENLHFRCIQTTYFLNKGPVLHEPHYVPPSISSLFQINVTQKKMTLENMRMYLKKTIKNSYTDQVWNHQIKEVEWNQVASKPSRLFTQPSTMQTHIRGAHIEQHTSTLCVFTNWHSQPKTTRPPASHLQMKSLKHFIVLLL